MFGAHPPLNAANWIPKKLHPWSRYLCEHFTSPACGPEARWAIGSRTDASHDV